MVLHLPRHPLQLRRMVVVADLEEVGVPEAVVEGRGVDDQGVDLDRVDQDLEAVDLGEVRTEAFMGDEEVDLVEDLGEVHGVKLCIIRCMALSDEL